MKILIRHGRVINPATRFDQVADIGMVDGQVAFIGSGPSDFEPDEIIDAKGLWVLPGLVDISARLREPGNESRGSLQTELEAAVAGGVTSLAIPPDTDPPLDEPGLIQMLKHRAHQLGRSKVYPIGALTVKLKGELITEMGELHAAGCMAFSQGDIPLKNTSVLYRVMQYASTFDFPIWLRPQDPFLSHSGLAHDGYFATLRGLVPIPPASELIALYTYIEIAREAKARLHIQQISSRLSLDLIRQAKADGLPITCDVSIHHLHLCDEDIGYYDTNCFVFPPLRAAEDRQALREAVADGTIDAICSDHAPVDADEKLTPFAEATPGMTAIELLLPLTLQWAREEKVDVMEALSHITTRPANILGIQAGSLEVGGAADVCLVDPELKWIPGGDTLCSLGKNTPFVGRELTGKVVQTFIEGVTTYKMP